MDKINLSDYSIEELEKAIERKKQLKPIMLQNLNFDKLKEACQKYLDDASNGHVNSNCENDIFETAMMVCFGNDIFDYIDEVADE